MKRKNPLFMFYVALFMLVPALWQALPAKAQSPAPQQSRSAQPKDSNDQDLINPDRPGIADGSGVVGAKKIQVESGFQKEFRHQGQTREHTLFIPTLLRIGINSHLEARIEGNTFTRRTDFDVTDMTNHTSGLAPFSFGIKYQIQESDGVRHPSVGVIARIFPAWGSGDFHTQQVTGDLRLAADWEFAPKLSLNPNVGVGLYEDEGKRFTAGLFAMTLSYAPTKKLNPFIDIGLQAPEEKGGKTAVIADAGVAYIVGRNIQLDVSVGTGAHGNSPPHPFISFGISFRTNSLQHRK
jgi:hypothetical protein